MVEQDIFVGIVAILTGLFVFASAAFQSQWIGRFWLARHIESASNGSVSRLVIMGIGTTCMVLGTMLLLGFFPSNSSETDSTNDHQTQFIPSVD